MTHTPTTAAIAVCNNYSFTDEEGQEDPTKITITLTVDFNGLAGRVGLAVTFPFNATMAQKQAAVRQACNSALNNGGEPNVTLTNATIQIVGLPV